MRHRVSPRLRQRKLARPWDWREQPERTDAHHRRCASTIKRYGGSMITYDLTGKTALVTGGASGIGFATSAMLGRNGANVAVNFLADDPRGKEALGKLNADGLLAIEAPGDVGDAADCERMVKQAIDDLGRLDLLVS